jgi:hypothetical protein
MPPFRLHVAAAVHIDVSRVNTFCLEIASSEALTFEADS